MGNRIYVAGKFSWAGPFTGSGTAVSAASGERVSSAARPNRPVLAAAADPSGGWFVRGSFTKVADSSTLPDLQALPSYGIRETLQVGWGDTYTQWTPG